MPRAQRGMVEAGSEGDTVHPNSSRAFTLIELLVVVAVIAILAALALPNFLEAQTRAKVARARADLRSVVTAIETYRADFNGYPTYHYSDVGSSQLEFHIGGRVLAWGQPDPAWDGRNPITTPISYMTSMPRDPFNGRFSGPPDAQEYMYVNWDYAMAIPNLPSGLVEPFERAREAYGGYRLHSKGPDTEGPNTGTPYDPTNGTTSEGDITYGPGCGFDHLVPMP